MADYDNTNTGALFKNDKDGNDKRPDYRGQGNVDGVEVWISAWISTSKKDGSKYMSLKFKRKDSDEHSKPPVPKTPPPAGAFADMDDDIPFISCSLEDDVIFRKLRWECWQ